MVWTTKTWRCALIVPLMLVCSVGLKAAGINENLKSFGDEAAIGMPVLDMPKMDFYYWDERGSFETPFDDPQFLWDAGFFFTGNSYLDFGDVQKLSLWAAPGPSTNRPFETMAMSAQPLGVISHTPEPGSFWMMGSAFCVIAAYAVYKVGLSDPARVLSESEKKQPS